MMDDFDFYSIQDENTRKLVSRLLNQVFRLNAELKDSQSEVKNINEIRSDVKQINLLQSRSQEDLQKLDEIQTGVEKLAQIQNSSQTDLHKLNDIQAEVQQIVETQTQTQNHLQRTNEIQDDTQAELQKISSSQSGTQDQIQKLFEAQNKTQIELEKLGETQSGMHAALERLGDIQSDIQRLMLAQIQIQRLLDAQAESMRVNSIRSELQQLREDVNMLASGSIRIDDRVVDLPSSTIILPGEDNRTDDLSIGNVVSPLNRDESQLNQVAGIALENTDTVDGVKESMLVQELTQEEIQAAETGYPDVTEEAEVQPLVGVLNEGIPVDHSSSWIGTITPDIPQVPSKKTARIHEPNPFMDRLRQGIRSVFSKPKTQVAYKIDYSQRVRRKIAFPWERFTQKLALQMFLVSILFLVVIVSMIWISTSGLSFLASVKPLPPTETISLPIMVNPTETGVPSPTSVPTATVVPTATLPALSSLAVAVDPGVPPELSQSLKMPDNIKRVDDLNTANIRFWVVSSGEAPSRWIYALVAPYPTITDNVLINDLKGSWSGTGKNITNDQPLYLSESTRVVFEAFWGPANTSRIVIVPEERLVDQIWVKPYSWAIIPFEKLDPRWKVIRVEGQSPIDKNMDQSTYPLAVPFGWVGDEGAVSVLSNQTGIEMLPSNRDVSKLTTLVMTGTTALIRATAARMEEKGLTYPGGDIQAWLKDADLTHVSNEVSFDPNCPRADFHRETEVFCSRPEYIELLNYVGVDIVELSGNHLMDFGWNAFAYSLELYKKNNIKYFAGGINASEAWTPLKIEHNGNKLEFIGCNASGPQYVWATENQPGAAQCDLEKLLNLVTVSRSEGYLPIVTFQHFETYGYEPVPQQKTDFDAVSKAGAIIVSGSQAHFPMTINFLDNRFIHYGLGNLFFDQMDIPVKGTRREFIDRHVIYDGKYISTELLTAMLEDYARPRPMDAVERTDVLSAIFAASGW